jgi:hypothetical protein
MPLIFTLRLIPDPPTSAEDFAQNYLQNLQIKAFDRSVKDPSQDAELGTAAGVAVPTDPLEVGTNPPSLTPSIVQHLVVEFPPSIKAVATAIIVVKDDPARTEFPDPTGLDVRLEITRGNTKIDHEFLEFNIPARNIQALSASPIDYTGQPNTTPANPEFINLPLGAYVKIPGPRPSDTINPGPIITPDPKGAPPEFDALVTAIDAVLALDHPPPSTAISLATLAEPLTAPQVAVIASELSFNRLIFPLPTPRTSIENLYTGDISHLESERVQFEGALTAYYATHNANAERLKKFVYLASAAVFAEKASFREIQATLELPIDPAMRTATTAGTIPVTLIEQDTTQALSPTLAVPAAYFYALSLSFSSSQKPEKLYERALTSTREFVVNNLQLAIDAGALKKGAHDTISDLVTPKVTANLDQAVRRLTALSGSFVKKPKYKAVLQDNLGGTLSGDVAALVTRWLGRLEPDSQLTAVFWRDEFTQKDYLEVILQVISGGKSALEKDILSDGSFPNVTIAKASDIAKIQDQDWIAFFKDNPNRLPDFVALGNTEDRARGFIQFLRTLFSIPATTVPDITPIKGNVPSFGNYDTDSFWRFMSNIPGGFDFVNFPSESVLAMKLHKHGQGRPCRHFSTSIASQKI